MRRNTAALKMFTTMITIYYLQKALTEIHKLAQT